MRSLILCSYVNLMPCYLSYWKIVHVVSLNLCGANYALCAWGTRLRLAIRRQDGISSYVFFCLFFFAEQIMQCELCILY